VRRPETRRSGWRRRRRRGRGRTLPSGEKCEALLQQPGLHLSAVLHDHHQQHTAPPSQQTRIHQL